MMNYLFQLDGVGPNASCCLLQPDTHQPSNEFTAGSVTQLTDLDASNARDVLNLGLVHSLHRRAHDSQPRHAALRRHSAHRRYGLSREWVRRAHHSGVVERAEHQLRRPVCIRSMRGYNDWPTSTCVRWARPAASSHRWQACFRSAPLQRRSMLLRAET